MIDCSQWHQLAGTQSQPDTSGCFSSPTSCVEDLKKTILKKSSVSGWDWVSRTAEAPRLLVETFLAHEVCVRSAGETARKRAKEQQRQRTGEANGLVEILLYTCITCTVWSPPLFTRAQSIQGDVGFCLSTIDWRKQRLSTCFINLCVCPLISQQSRKWLWED